jgi:hypothetical protein
MPIYFLTYQDNIKCPNSVKSDMGYIKTEHFNSEKKMINKLFEQLVFNPWYAALEDILETLNENMEKTIPDEHYCSVADKFFVLFPQIDKLSMKQLKSMCKKMNYKDRLTVLSILEDLYGDIKPLFDIAYGKVKTI